MKPSIKTSMTSLREGQPVLLLSRDDSQTMRGALIVAAENATPGAVNLLAREGRGVVCVGISAQTAKRLDLGPMVPFGDDTQDVKHCVSTISIDASHGITTGISAGDRAITLQLLADETSVADDFVKPGHLFPYVVHPHGVLGHANTAEAAVDLAVLAGLKPVGAFCGILDRDGQLAGEEYLLDLAERTGLASITMDELIRYRLFNDKSLQEMSKEELVTGHGQFQLVTFTDPLRDDQHYLLKSLTFTMQTVPTVYIHRACVKSDVFGAKGCHCRSNLDDAMAQTQRDGGLVIYVGEKTRDTEHCAAIATQLLSHIGVDTIRLQTPWEGLCDALIQADVSVAQVLGSQTRGCGHVAREAMAFRS